MTFLKYTYDLTNYIPENVGDNLMISGSISHKGLRCSYWF